MVTAFCHVYFFFLTVCLGEQLYITEVMWNPSDPNGGSEKHFSTSDFEFIEIWNKHTEAIPLLGLSVREGVAFNSYSGNKILAPNDICLLVADHNAFLARYQNVPPEMILGSFDSGALSNNGEQISIKLPQGNGQYSTKTFTYQADGAGTWPNVKKGQSIFPYDVDGEYDGKDRNPNNWYAGTPSPGAVHVTPFQLIITEIMHSPLAKSQLEQESLDPTWPRDFQFIEIFNPGRGRVDLSSLRIDGDAQFSFPRGTKLDWKDTLLIVGNQEVFKYRYRYINVQLTESWKVVGEFQNELTTASGKSGDVHLVQNQNLGQFVAPIHKVRYTLDGKFPHTVGHSLVLDTVPPENKWRSSYLVGGSPGEWSRLGTQSGETCRIDKTLDPALEPSGLAYNHQGQYLLVVGDEGNIAKIDAITHDVIKIWDYFQNPKRDIEAITFADESSKFVYVGIEDNGGVAQIVEFDMDLGTGVRTFSLNELPIEPDSGLEGLSYVPNVIAQYGGYFYAASQKNGNVYRFSLPINGGTGTAVTSLPKFDPEFKNNLASVSYFEKRLYLSFPGERAILSYPVGTNGELLQGRKQIYHPIPDAEGVLINHAFSPRHPYEVYIASDPLREIYKLYLDILSGTAMHMPCIRFLANYSATPLMDGKEDGKGDKSVKTGNLVPTPSPTVDNPTPKPKSDSNNATKLVSFLYFYALQILFMSLF